MIPAEGPESPKIPQVPQQDWTAFRGRSPLPKGWKCLGSVIYVPPNSFSEGYEVCLATVLQKSDSVAIGFSNDYGEHALLHLDRAQDWRTWRETFINSWRSKSCPNVVIYSPMEGSKMQQFMAPFLADMKRNKIDTLNTPSPTVKSWNIEMNGNVCFGYLFPPS